MNFLPIWAITLKNFRTIKRDLNRPFTIIFWTLVGALTWGFFGVWSKKTQNGITSKLDITLLFAALLWQITNRASIEIASSLLQEIWSHNVVNIFTSPLKLYQLILGLILFSIIFVGFGISFCISVSCLIYNIPFITAFSLFFIFGPFLFVSGIWIGILSLAFVLYFGKSATDLVYMIGWFFGLISGIYYSVSVFPTIIQKISYCIPMTYIFEAMRNFILNNNNPIYDLFTSLTISIIYTVFSILFFIFMFNKSKEKGLARLSD